MGRAGRTRRSHVKDGGPLTSRTGDPRASRRSARGARPLAATRIGTRTSTTRTSARRRRHSGDLAEMWGRCGGDVGEMTRTSAQRHISIHLPTPPHISPYLARRRTSLSWRRRRPSSQARRGWLGLTLALPLALALTRTLTELAGKAGLARADPSPTPSLSPNPNPNRARRQGGAG